MKICRAGLHEYESSRKDCPVCRKANSKAWYEKNREKRIVHVKAYYEANKATAKDYYRANKEKCIASANASYDANKEQRKKNNRVRYEANKESYKARVKAWYEANKEKMTQHKNQYCSNRRKTDPLFKLRCNIGGLISICLKNHGYSKISKTKQILGCDFKTLQTHLILSAIKNYGYWVETEKYHIDHIVPVSSATSEEELLKLNHYSNLQYLYPQDNMAKGDRVDWNLISESKI